MTDNEALAAALKPFAEQAKTHSDKMPDEMFIDDYEQHDKSKWVSHAGIRIGDLRRAAKAHAALEAAERIAQPVIAGGVDRWEVVPVKQTGGMSNNGFTTFTVRNIYKALLCDAPSAPSIPEGMDVVDALKWYGEQARLCRLIHGEGDAGRQALANDGGNRARAALASAP